jgi:hypothetical protein
MGGQIEPARLAGLLEHFKSQHISDSLAQMSIVITKSQQIVTTGANNIEIKFNAPEFTMKAVS